MAGRAGGSGATFSGKSPRTVVKLPTGVGPEAPPPPPSPMPPPGPPPPLPACTAAARGKTNCRCKTQNCRAVRTVDQKGKPLRSFCSITDAAEALGLTGPQITRVATPYYIVPKDTMKGHRFQFLTEEKKSKSKAVLQVDYAGRVLREFPTATAAGEANQIDNSRIGLLCNEAHRDAHIHGKRFRWKDPPAVMCNVCSEQLDCWYDGPDVRCEGIKCANGIHASCAGLTPGHTGEWFCSEHQSLCRIDEASYVEGFGMHKDKVYVDNEDGSTNLIMSLPYLQPVHTESTKLADRRHYWVVSVCQLTPEEEQGVSFMACNEVNKYAQEKKAKGPKGPKGAKGNGKGKKGRTTFRKAKPVERQIASRIAREKEDAELELKRSQDAQAQADDEAAVGNGRALMMQSMATTGTAASASSSSSSSASSSSPASASASASKDSPNTPKRDGATAEAGAPRTGLPSQAKAKGKGKGKVKGKGKATATATTPSAAELAEAAALEASRVAEAAAAEAATLQGLAYAAAGEPARKKQRTDTVPTTKIQAALTKQQREQERAIASVRLPGEGRWEMKFEKGTGDKYFVDHSLKTTAWNAPPGTTVALDVLGEQEVAEVVRLLNIPTADNWRGIDGASLAAATQSELEEEKGPNLSTIHSKKLLRAVKGYQAEGGVDMALIPNWAPGKAAA